MYAYDSGYDDGTDFDTTLSPQAFAENISNRT